MTKKQLALNKILFCFDYDGVNYRQTLSSLGLFFPGTSGTVVAVGEQRLFACALAWLCDTLSRMLSGEDGTLPNVQRVQKV
jgi:hypothetical protein